MLLPPNAFVLSVVVTAAMSNGPLVANEKDDAKVVRRRTENVEAIRLYTVELEKNPKNATAFVIRGNCHLQLGELDSAAGDTNEAMSDYDMAIADYGEAIRLVPKFAAAYHNRGTAWRGKFEFDKSIADYDEAIRLGSKDVLTYICRGASWEAKGGFDQALSDYDEAILIDPKSKVAHKKRAWIHATCTDDRYRDGAKAVEDATKACYWTNWKSPYSPDPDCPGTLAAAYAEAGQFDKAVEWQEKAIDLARDNDDFKTRLKLYQAGKPYREGPGKK